MSGSSPHSVALQWLMCFADIGGCVRFRADLELVWVRVWVRRDHMTAHGGQQQTPGPICCRPMRGIAIALGIISASAALAGCGGGSSTDATTTTPTTTTLAADDIPRISPVPMPVPSESPAPTITAVPNTPIPAAGPGCDEAPARIVALINAAFADGEHLENMQSVSGPSGTVIVGGNIVDATGTRISSADSWVMSGGAIYGLSSDARRHTLVPDGRDVIGDWTTYNDAVGECVVAATRAANG